jgi:hypothetical protein
MERTAPQLWGMHAGCRGKISIDVRRQATGGMAGNVVVEPVFKAKREAEVKRID